MILRSKDKRELILDCDGNDDDGFVFRFGFDNFLDGEYFACYLSLYSGDFYSDQDSVWHKIKRKSKAIWSIITGKEYRYKELVLNRESFEEFADTIEEYRREINGKFPL